MTESQRDLLIEALALLYAIGYDGKSVSAFEMKMKAIKMIQNALKEDQ